MKYKKDKQIKFEQDDGWKKTSSDKQQAFQELTDQELDLVAGGRSGWFARFRKWFFSLG